VADGQKFIDWVISPKGQRVISDYKIKGHQAFFADAK
jgi:tungstate transport system substrate-binding protein